MVNQPQVATVLWQNTWRSLIVFPFFGGRPVSWLENYQKAPQCFKAMQELKYTRKGSTWGWGLGKKLKFWVHSADASLWVSRCVGLGGRL